MNRPRVAGPSWLPVLVLALLLAPWLGALHQIVHQPQVHAPSVLTDDQALFGQHDSEADCLVFDQLSLGHGLPVAAWSMPPQGQPCRPTWSCICRASPPRLAHFQARAPPRFV